MTIGRIEGKNGEENGGKFRFGEMNVRSRTAKTTLLVWL